MIRKAVIVVLTILTVVALYLWAASWVAPFHGSTVSRNLIVICDIRSGSVRLVWERNRPLLTFWDPNLEKHFFVPYSFYAFAYSCGGYSRVDLGVDFRVLPFLFAPYPTLAFIRGPVRRWRRRKRGLCTHCGYNLTGLVEPRCPECGQEI